jgi:hypothetical protein
MISPSERWALLDELCAWGPVFYLIEDLSVGQVLEITGIAMRAFLSPTDKVACDLVSGGALIVNQYYSVKFRFVSMTFTQE